jgi:hypothetical protein
MIEEWSMYGFAGDTERDMVLKRNVAEAMRRKLAEKAAPHTESQPQPGRRKAEHATPASAAELQTENQRLQSLLGELLLKNQQLRAELALRERHPEVRLR